MACVLQFPPNARAVRTEPDFEHAINLHTVDDDSSTANPDAGNWPLMRAVFNRAAGVVNQGRQLADRLKPAKQKEDSGDDQEESEGDQEESEGNQEIDQNDKNFIQLFKIVDAPNANAHKAEALNTAVQKFLADVTPVVNTGDPEAQRARLWISASNRMVLSAVQFKNANGLPTYMEMYIFDEIHEAGVIRIRTALKKVAGTLPLVFKANTAFKGTSILDHMWDTLPDGVAKFKPRAKLHFPDLTGIVDPRTLANIWSVVQVYKPMGDHVIAVSSSERLVAEE